MTENLGTGKREESCILIFANVNTERVRIEYEAGKEIPQLPENQDENQIFYKGVKSFTQLSTE